jgi:hypothetical protein
MALLNVRGHRSVAGACRPAGADRQFCTGASKFCVTNNDITTSFAVTQKPHRHTECPVGSIDQESVNHAGPAQIDGSGAGLGLPNRHDAMNNPCSDHRRTRPAIGTERAPPGVSDNSVRYHSMPASGNAGWTALVPAR